MENMVENLQALARKLLAYYSPRDLHLRTNPLHVPKLAT